MSSKFLISGEDLLANKPDFRLVGRGPDLQKLSAILMRSKANSVLLTGPGGVGCSSLCIGLQAMKKDPTTPFDIVVKRLFFLESDGLFASGNSSAINDEFQRIMTTLEQTQDSILIIRETKDFIDAARNSGNDHFINSIVKAVEAKKTQVILEASDDHLDTVLKCHSNIQEAYTLMDLEEPTPEALIEIVTCASRDLAAFHRIEISAEAIAAAVETTNKYRAPRDPGLGYNRAQPDRAITLLDRALSRFRFTSHSEPTNLKALERTVNTATDDASKNEAIMAFKAAQQDWNVTQEKMRYFYEQQRDAEAEVLQLEDNLRELKAEEDARRIPAAPEAGSKTGGLSLLMNKGGFDSVEAKEIKTRISAFKAAAEENKNAFYELASKIDMELELTPDIVQAEFSLLSGIPLSKINEDERVKLIRLEQSLKDRIFGQDAVIKHVVDAVKVFKIGRRNKGAPLPMLFLGPSGVGKTELAKAIAVGLMDNEEALLRFDMSEYMEKHAVARLIGAPPGYEGFEVGGILTNAMRQNGKRIILFDEIEKAHPDVFNVLLQVLGDGRLTDNIGRTVRFADAVVICTTNAGQVFFLQVNDDYSFEDAKIEALAELDKIYRAELLNRFQGRHNILCFNRLFLDSIQKIVRRELVGLDTSYGDQGIRIVADESVITQFCHDHYKPVSGARGLPGLIKVCVEPHIVNRILQSKPESNQVMKLDYDLTTKEFIVTWETDNV